MSGLPTTIPPQSLPLTQKGPEGNLYIDFNWYLFLYNLSKQVFSTPDVPVAQPVQPVPVTPSPFVYTASVNGTLSVSAGVVSAVIIIRGGVNVPTGITSTSQLVINALTDEKGSGGLPGFVAGVDFTDGTTTSLTLSQTYGSATDLWVAFDGAEQGPNTYSLTGKVLTFNAAIPLGTVNVFVKGASSVIVGTSGGLVPVQQNDKVQITYSVAPTVAFLPS